MGVEKSNSEDNVPAVETGVEKPLSTDDVVKLLDVIPSGAKEEFIDFASTFDCPESYTEGAKATKRNRKRGGLGE